MSNPLLIRRYLLGDLAEGEAAAFEEEYFVSDDRFSEMLAAEDDLIEAFLHRELTANDRRLFEARFLATPRGRQKVALASALGKVSGVAQRSKWREALAIAAAVVFLLISAGMLRELVVMRRQIEQLERVARPTPKTSAPSARGAMPIVFSIVLNGGQERGSSAGTTLVLPRDSATA